MDPVSKLTEYFRDLPGIGPRQARRFVYYLLTRNNGTLEDIARLILEIKKNVKMCEKCFRFFTNETRTTTCPQCADPSRDSSRLMVVARDADFESIEKSHAYNGFYFILGGTVPILEKDPSARVRSRELSRRIESDSAVTEVILSMNATADGEHTADYIRSLVRGIPGKESLTISTLGRGLSTGSELEYADSETIKSALTNRSTK